MSSEERDLEQESFDQEPVARDLGRVSLATRASEYRAVVAAAFKQDWPIWLVSLVTFLSGALSIILILLTRVPQHVQFLLPYGLFHWTRSLTLVLGFVLIYLSYHLFRRSRAAWWVAVFAVGLEVVTHLNHLRLWYTALAPIVTFVLLLVFQGRFSVRSESRNIWLGFILLLGSILIAVLYGTVGFWMLDKRDFGITFRFEDALLRTLREFALLGNGDLVARSTEARWFLHSLDILGIVAGCFAMYSLFRPVISHLLEIPRERAQAKAILNQYGRSTYDYFKVWPDKSYFFSSSSRSFISYRTVLGVAFCLGDPVGPEDEMESVLRAFLNFCSENGWMALFLMMEQPALYQRLGLSLLKIGEEAVVDLEHFTKHTLRRKYFRYIRRKFDESGYKLIRYGPPIPASILDEVEYISHEWLSLPGHREFGFMQGTFGRGYIEKTVIYALREESGKMVAFVNQGVSFRPQEATFDMMRHLPGIHWGTMDYLFQNLMLILKQEGFETFNFGVAPFVGIGKRPDATLTEKAVNQLFERLDRFVHSKGIRQYKVKFEPVWIDRFVAYQGGPIGLVKMALAINRVL